MLPELQRGACGFMPGCHLTDIYVEIWGLWDAGDRGSARALFNKLLPLINLGEVLGVALAKEVLVRRGVISHAALRRPDAVRLDRYDLEEMERCLAELEPFYRV
jgi:4-hydroxy-tetrahydrodipicolinate synthase